MITLGPIAPDWVGVWVCITITGCVWIMLARHKDDN